MGSFKEIKERLEKMLERNASFKELDELLEEVAFMVDEKITSKEYCELVNIAQDSVRI